MKVSLIIPIKNEADSIVMLYNSICQQTVQPDEVILVDGGSTDKSVEKLKRLTAKDMRFRIIETIEATPGKGRNVGIKNSKYDWLALTDAGIKLESDWLENLLIKSQENSEAEIVYGNFAPITETFFEKCAALAYVSPQTQNSIRNKFIASCLMKKKVWETVGGFPDMRAAEDLIFMEDVEAKKFKIAYAPEAQVYWHLRPDLLSTFRKFILYSKHNVWAGRQWDWHYGVVKQYLLILPFIILVFLHSRWWLLIVPIWLLVRTFKRIFPHRFEFGLKTIFNPAYFFSVMFLALIIDLATFIGWGQAILSSKS